MLVNPRNKRTANAEFQRYLDARELQLYRQMQPVLSAAVRMSTRVGLIQAQDYLVTRGEPILLNAYKRVYHDQYLAVGAAVSEKTGVATGALIALEGKASQATLALRDYAWEDFDEEPEEADTWGGFLAGLMGPLTARAGTRITSISANLAKDITTEVMTQLGQGKSNDVIARGIRSTAPDFSKGRAATIARTETHASAMSAMDDALAYKRLTVKWKEWLSAGDARVRPAHKEMNGTRITADAVFQTPDGAMRYPGDDTLGAATSGLINCRCTVIFSTEQSAV